MKRLPGIYLTTALILIYAYATSNNSTFGTKMAQDFWKTALPLTDILTHQSPWNALTQLDRGPATYLGASGGQTFVYFSSTNFYHLLLHKLLFKLNRVISQALVCFKAIKVQWPKN